MNLFQMFSVAADRFPEKIALIQGERRYTYAQLSEEVNRIASSFNKLGLKQGERVMVLLKNRLETAVVFWAVQKLGAVFSPINLRLSMNDILYCVNDLEARFIVFEDASKHLIKNQKFHERPLFIGLENMLGDISYAELLKEGTVQVEPCPVSGDDLSVILYTSGTSGKPKGVPRSHNNEYASTVAHIIQCHYRQFDRTLGIPALSHTIGLRSLLAVTFLNGVYVALPDFDPYEALDAIGTEEISCLFLTPTLYHDLVSHPHAYGCEFTSVRSIVYSGALMPKELIHKCEELIKPDYFVNQYGSTEIYTFTTSDVRKKPGSAGKPGMHERIKLVKPDRERKSPLHEITAGGEIGEIIVEMNSPEAFRGYWNRPDATKKTIRDGWYLTGDIGFKDADGDLHVVGRIDDMIISSGENIYPQEIEQVLAEHDSVLEAAVVGEEDDRWGQVVTAFVVTNNIGLTPQALDHFCKLHKRLPNYKRPRKYVFVTDIPKNSAGKILRRELRDGNFTEIAL
ncbi:class I adenylate-forming enzyme family protein [Bacillus sp. T33-2]|uniref:class I adenylate-forming enzyme family protein n=1 Tax=Bacillus sp. T33-2 TaxID=2054168 RepID=UPI000C78CE8A|nr:AMP-binding protein [Bacillus sp. T33-2]PLR97560.1 4-chlorobenzoate--CoA ligase [Bacillus sp. T33-2]